ncbi:hypothetical protein FB446DRAFT_760218 [Lentinula raphanica]|nr:hypothetical protein FB446DRAFT_760218 [Lentinula raphanica]
MAQRTLLLARIILTPSKALRWFSRTVAVTGDQAMSESLEIGVRLQHHTRALSLHRRSCEVVPDQNTIKVRKKEFTYHRRSSCRKGKGRKCATLLAVVH